MEKLTTIPHTAPDDVIGYVVNTMLTEDAGAAVSALRTELEQEFPGALWMPPIEALHITIMDWLTSLEDYGKDKDALYATVGPKYREALEDVLDYQEPFNVAFDEIVAFPNAIIIKGRDDGSIGRIREQFLGRCTLLPGTKVQGSDFIHSTICRFTEELNFEQVKLAIARQTVRIEQPVREIQLCRETRFGMQEYETLRRFELLSISSPQSLL